MNLIFELILAILGIFIGCVIIVSLLIVILLILFIFIYFIIRVIKEYLRYRKLGLKSAIQTEWHILKKKLFK